MKEELRRERYLLKQRRILDYEFSWTRMLSNKGNTGVALQYVHARLAK
jgi:arginyl-tRNA synthetase